MLRLGELEQACLLGDDRAFGLWFQLWDKLRDKSASLLRVQVASFFRHVDEGRDHLVVALLGALLSCTSGSADFNWKLFAARVPDELARLLLNVPGRAGGLVDGFALLGPAAVANLLYGLVALLYGLVEGLLLERHLTRFFKVLLADFFLCGIELRDVRVVALLDVLVGALQDGVLLERRDLLVFGDAADAGVWIVLTSGEIDPALDLSGLLSPASAV